MGSRWRGRSRKRQTSVDLRLWLSKAEAAFYGPKLDFMVRDALGRQWRVGYHPGRLQPARPFRSSSNVGSDNQKHRPVMIHRAPFGSMERFVAVLIEHCAGNFPLWLAPDQIAVLPISERFNDYAQEVLDILKGKDVRGSPGRSATKRSPARSVTLK